MTRIPKFQRLRQNSNSDDDTKVLNRTEVEFEASGLAGKSKQATKENVSKDVRESRRLVCIKIENKFQQFGQNFNENFNIFT